MTDDPRDQQTTSSPQAARSSWRPIATYMHGTVFLFRRWPGRDINITGTGFYVEHASRWVVRLSANFHTSQEAIELLEQPTHWMPLPDPPVVGSEERQEQRGSR